jgi:hypothetical protein
MKLTNELKAQFFALYWNQRVMSRLYNGKSRLNNVKVDALSLSDEKNNTGDYIELKPLSTISDEDAIEIGKLAGDDSEDYEKEYGKGYYKMYLLDFAMYQSKFTDILRSKGFAIDWRGISVEEMIKAGWIKLKE